NAGKIDAIRSGAETPLDPYMAYLHERGLAAAHVADLNGRKSYADTQPTPLPDDAYCDNWLAQNALDLLKAAPDDRPWHLVVNFTGPHNPMDVTQAMYDRYQGVDFPQPHASAAERDRAQSRNYPAPEQHTQIRRNYSAMVENIDRWVGIFVAELARRGELEHTIIVFSSDHGDMLGDHALWAKTQPYQPSIGVPLIIAGPGVREGVQCDAPVSLIDLAPTFLDWAGVAVPAEMDGRSLAGLLSGERDAPRSVVRSALGAWRLAFDGRFKLVAGYRHPSEPEGTDAALRLFDLARDPQETVDVATSRPDVVERLRPYL
ncbi:MAG TPA: sulfatase-like hydrolase/transferase, partial [Limnochordia bacterium]|nr:sulfatase-like hydrolase/transferase [Limnochordia bacterium]